MANRPQFKKGTIISLRICPLNAEKARRAGRSPGLQVKRFLGQERSKKRTYRMMEISVWMVNFAQSWYAENGVRRKIASAATVAGVERLARADYRLAATVDQSFGSFSLDRATGNLRLAYVNCYQADFSCSKTTTPTPNSDADFQTRRVSLIGCGRLRN
jgi:hypothetical protein